MAEAPTGAAADTAPGGGGDSIPAVRMFGYAVQAPC